MKNYELLNTKEYERVGNNEFPLKYITYEEQLELGLIKKSCCTNKKNCCKSKSNIVLKNKV